MDRCHYIRHEGQPVLMPGCLGTAVNGTDSCTCDTDRTRDATKIEDLMERVSYLEWLLDIGSNEPLRRPPSPSKH